MQTKNTHSTVIGYILWIVGFTGAHRFYYGKPKTGTLWLFTAGLCGIGWLVDAFLIPSMDREAERRFSDGKYSYSVAWVLLSFVGALGLHRLYQKKFGSGLLYLFTGGLLMVGVVYDYWTLNDQISLLNQSSRS